MIKKLLDKLDAVNPGWSTSSRERLIYYLYFAGQNAVYFLVSVQLTTYMMFQGVSYEKSAMVMLAVKIWDAVNDAVFGVVFDSVKFKSGKKFTPWLRLSTPLISITTLLLFLIPSSCGETAKLVWLAVAYILWDTAYTLCDVPIYGIITSMTQNIDERTSMMSFKGIWTGVGNAFSTVLASVLVSEHVGSSYSIAALIVAVVSFACMYPAAKELKERYTVVDSESFTIRSMLRYLFKNKYLLIYYLGYFFYSAGNVASSLNLFVSYYLFNDTLFSLVAGALGVVPSLAASLVVPALSRRFDKMKIYRVCAALTVVISTVNWVLGYESLVLYLVLTTLRSVPLSIIGVMMFMFTPDCAEYGEYTSHTQAKGITFAIQTFMSKFTGAVSSSLGMFILGLEGTQWVKVEVENFEQLKQLGVVQSEHALDVLWFVFMMVPAISCLLALVVWFFYRLTDRQVQIMADCNCGKIDREAAEKLLSEKKSSKDGEGAKAAKS